MRYDIYDLMGKEVSFKHKLTEVSGICEDVKRNVLDNEIILLVKNVKYVFQEPNRIETDEKGMDFVYGTEISEDQMEFCGEQYSVHWGEDVRKSIGREKTLFKQRISYGNPA